MSNALIEVDRSIKAGDWDQALQTLESLKGDPATAPEVYERLAHVQAVRGKYSSVIGTFLELVGMLLKSGHLEEAESVVQQVLSLRPESGEARERRIEIESKRGNMDRAVELSRELARLCMEQGDGERSIRLLQNALGQQPDNLDIAQELAEMFVTHGHIADGASAFRRVAAAFQAAGNPARACEAYRRLKVVQSDDCEVMLTLGRLYIGLGRYDEAEKELRSVLRHDLDHEQALLHLGWVCQLTGRYRSGILAFNKVLQNEPAHQVANRKLAELHVSQGMMSEAVAGFALAADGYLRAEATSEAIACFRHILSIEPGHSGAQHGLFRLGAALEPLDVQLPGLSISPIDVVKSAELEHALLEPSMIVIPEAPRLDEPEAPPEPRVESLICQNSTDTAPRPKLVRRGLIKVDFRDKVATPERKKRASTRSSIRHGLVGKSPASSASGDKPLLPSLSERQSRLTRPRPEPISAEVELIITESESEALVEDFAQDLFAPENEAKPQSSETIDPAEPVMLEDDQASRPELTFDFESREADCPNFFEAGSLFPEPTSSLFDPKSEALKVEPLRSPPRSPETDEGESNLVSLFDPQPDEAESDEVVSLFDPQPDEAESDEVVSLFDPQPDEAESDAVISLFDFKPEPAANDKILNLFDPQPEADDSDLIDLEPQVEVSSSEVSAEEVLEEESTRLSSEQVLQLPLDEQLFESQPEAVVYQDPDPVDFLSIEQRAEFCQTSDADEIEAGLQSHDAASLIAAYRKALEESPSNIVLRTRLADLHLRYGLLEDAVRHYREVIALRPDAIAPLRGVIQAELWNERYQQAGESLMALAQLYQRQGQGGKALDALQAVLTVDPMHCRALQEIARIFASLTQSNLASHHLRQLAETALQQGDISSAVSAFHQLVDLSEGSPSNEPAPDLAAGRYINLLLRRGQIPEAGRTLQRLERSGAQGAEITDLIISTVKAEMNPNELALHFNYGELCYLAGHLDRAIEAFQQTRRHPVYERSSYNALGLCFAGKRGLMMADLAISQFRKGLNLPGASPREELELRYNLATVQYESGRPQEALLEIETCQCLDPTYRDLAGWLERLRTETGKVCDHP